MLILIAILLTRTWRSCSGRHLAHADRQHREYVPNDGSSTSFTVGLRTSPQ